MEIRSPHPPDEPQWRVLWQGYNTFYGATVDPVVTDRLWTRLITSGDSVFGRFALDGDEIAGFALCVLHAHTWGIEPACLLEDLYVAPTRRRTGVARQLLNHLVAEAPTQSWARLYWHTREDNATARRLYETFTKTDDFVRYTIPFSGAEATAGGSET